MKITQEVRDLAAKQNSEGYVAATTPVVDAEEGMDEMSRVYNEGGLELYIGQGDRKYD